ncbi:MAG: hypothetical protein VKN72_29190 [Nostocales cyanobacterium 94392]|nr:hypothetical protein [Nostocales cyanobacterium 94392]
MTLTINAENTQIIQNNSSTRRLIIIAGDKGGVGKSMFARGLIQTYLDTKQRFVGFDANLSDSQLMRFYRQHCHLEEFPIFKNNAIDRFFDTLNSLTSPKTEQSGDRPESESLFLIKFPPYSRMILQSFIEDMNFLETVQADLDMRVTMVVVISRLCDSIQQLIDLNRLCEDKCDYVVVKNLFFGEPEEFTEYTYSPRIEEIKNQLARSKASYVDIQMPELSEDAYYYLDKNNMSFAEGIQQTGSLAVKGRITTWMKKFKQDIAPAKELLGLGGVRL